jgi:hypothetical protein
MKNALYLQIHKQAALEALNVEEAKKSRLHRVGAGIRRSLQKGLWEVGQSGDLALIVAIERFLVRNELEHYANSKGMKSSLATALLEISTIAKHLAFVADPARYSAIDEAYSLPQSRKNGIPYDEARQSFSSHHTRLSNLDKSRLTTEEKAVLDTRRDNLKAGIALYQHLQINALDGG